MPVFCNYLLRATKQPAGIFSISLIFLILQLNFTSMKALSLLAGITFISLGFYKV